MSRAVSARGVVFWGRTVRRFASPLLLHGFSRQGGSSLRAAPRCTVGPLRCRVLLHIARTGASGIFEVLS